MDDGNKTTLPPACALSEEETYEVLTFWDVSTLVQKKQVSRTWQQHCTNAINDKRTPTTAMVFQTNQELRDTVKKYTRVDENPHDAEEKAQTYGYPIGNWNVSNIEDFSKVFYYQQKFDEDINEWDVSNATRMNSMFQYAEEFNKPLSNWNTSNVETMNGMFLWAEEFNQSLSNWNTSQATDVAMMLSNATSFNQPLSKFDTSQVRDMECMFDGATSFDQNISNRDTSQVEDDATDMFRNATSFHRDYAPVSLDPTVIFDEDDDGSEE